MRQSRTMCGIWGTSGDEQLCVRALTNVGRALTGQRTRAAFGAVRIRELTAAPGAELHIGRSVEYSPMIALYYVREGGVDVAFSGRVRRFTRGEGFLADHDARTPVAPIGHLRLWSIVVPAESLASAALERGEVRAIDAHGSLLDAAFAFAMRIAEKDPGAMSGLESYYVERLLMEMVVGVAIQGADTQPDTSGRDLHAQGVAVIEARLSDPTLSPTQVAADVRISLRQLERAFRAQGTTVARAIRRARVEYACGLLTDRVYDVMTISTIAQHSGFSNGSSLARAFAQEGYTSPAEVRRTARVMAGVDT